MLCHSNTRENVHLLYRSIIEADLRLNVGVFFPATFLKQQQQCGVSVSRGRERHSAVVIIHICSVIYLDIRPIDITGRIRCSTLYPDAIMLERDDTFHTIPLSFVLLNQYLLMYMLLLRYVLVLRENVTFFHVSLQRNHLHAVRRLITDRRKLYSRY